MHVFSNGESGAGPLPFFRLRRLRPLLPVVFCGIGRTADAPKGFAIPARPAPDGATTFLEKRCWRSSGVGRSAAASAAGSRALYGRPALCVGRCVGLCGRGAGWHGARARLKACLLTRVLRRARHLLTLYPSSARNYKTFSLESSVYHLAV